jgi:hypothetical protein
MFANERDWDASKMSRSLGLVKEQTGGHVSFFDDGLDDRD